MTARVFIGILQNIFQSWSIIFSQSPKVAFWTNCAFPLKQSYWGLNIVERRVRLNNKMAFHPKILTVFADNIELINC